MGFLNSMPWIFRQTMCCGCVRLATAINPDSTEPHGRLARKEGPMVIEVLAFHQACIDNCRCAVSSRHSFVFSFPQNARLLLLCRSPGVTKSAATSKRSPSTAARD